MTVLARHAEHGRIYRQTTRNPTWRRTYYCLAPKGTAKRLIRRLSKLGNPRTDQLVELRAARNHEEGNGVLFVRCSRGTDPLTGTRYERKAYCSLPLDYKLREVQRPPGYK